MCKEVSKERIAKNYKYLTGSEFQTLLEIYIFSNICEKQVGKTAISRKSLKQNHDVIILPLFSILKFQLCWIM